MTREIHIAETLGVGSVENFLTPIEIQAVIATLQELIDADGRERYDTDRHTTLHSIPGHTPAHAMRVYEPAGRLEIPVPETAEQILDAALAHAWPAIRRGFPSAAACREWMYVEYGPGQHITPHIDGIALQPDDHPRQIAGISVVLEAAHEGGDFFIATTSGARLWSDHAATSGGYHPDMAFAHDGADTSAAWFRDLPRTPWTAAPAPGTALLYGSQLTHGTTPVRAGRARKLISWITDGS